METEDVIKVADTMLLTAKAKGGLISTMAQAQIITRAGVDAPGNIVNIAAHLLESKGLAQFVGDFGTMSATALGIQAAGQLAQYLKEEIEVEELKLQATKATVRSAALMEEQLEQAKRDAGRAHKAMVWSIIAALVSALFAALTWIFPRH